MADIKDRRSGSPDRHDPPPPIAAPVGPAAGGKRQIIGASLAGVPLHIDADGSVGTFDPSQGGARLDRTSYLDGEQLLGAIQGIVRREVRAGMVRAKLAPRDEHPEQGPDYLVECVAAGCERPRQDSLVMRMWEGDDALTVLLPLCAEHIAAVQASPIQMVDARELVTDAEVTMVAEDAARALRAALEERGEPPLPGDANP